MKIVQKIGLALFIVGLFLFTISSFLGSFKPDKETILSSIGERETNNIGNDLVDALANKSFSSPYAFTHEIWEVHHAKNEQLKAAQDWDNVMYSTPQEVSLPILLKSEQGLFTQNWGLMFFLTFGLGIIGALMYIIPNVILLGAPGIKNDKIYQNGVTNKGWLAYFTFAYLVGFYIILYFYPANLAPQILLVSPVSEAISGNPAGQWFLYGFLYCTVMAVMAVRMYIKYRHNKYQIIRTSSVLFFQIAFAFLIPEILARFNMPYMDFKNAWPLDYDFFFEWNLNTLIARGKIGIFMLVWGIVLTLIVVPVFTYFYGKRWYCSWVCGCGGLAETLGDPYRQHSDKSIKAWKIERYLIHGVLVFAILMTGMTLYTYFSGATEIAGFNTYDVQKSYGFLIGSVFSGIIGTGFYPVMGNRVWCRFGCPLAAYMGIVQRFKSRFRITTNGGQCISCGNCSTYCEQGIDVRAYAQKGQNIVRSSCVGCGICAAVCPRGVLKLENGLNDDGSRMEAPVIIIGSENKYI